MLQLYYVPQTRSTRPRWILEELAVPYELVVLPRSLEERKKSDYIKIHPHGRVPALVDGDVVLFESAAIALYLADKYIEKGLAPPLSSPLRGPYLQWALYAATTFEPPVYQIYRHTQVLPDEDRSSFIVREAKGTLEEIFQTLVRELGNKPFLLGDKFTAADVLIGSVATWARGLGLVERHPVLVNYAKRLSSRPAFQKARSDD